MLPLRLCLILAILAGLGVIGLSHFVLKPQIQGIIDKRDENEKGWNAAKVQVSNLTKKLKETESELATTKKDLDDTKAQLAATTEQLEAKTKLAAQQAEAITRLNAEKKKLSDDLAAWAALGLTVDQVAGVIQREKTYKQENDVLKDENSLLAKEAKTWKDRYFAVTSDKEVDPPVPATVRGKVMVVDPKWDFLVLDVGANQKVPEKGVLLVSRNGTLVAKVRVMSVQGNRSIANIMPGWKLKDVMEGDQVFPYAPVNL